MQRPNDPGTQVSAIDVAQTEQESQIADAPMNESPMSRAKTTSTAAGDLWAAMSNDA